MRRKIILLKNDIWKHFEEKKFNFVDAGIQICGEIFKISF